MDARRRVDDPPRGRLISVNVGTPRQFDTGNRVVETAIWSDRVEGRVKVRGVNLDGDR